MCGRSLGGSSYVHQLGPFGRHVEGFVALNFLAGRSRYPISSQYTHLLKFHGSLQVEKGSGHFLNIFFTSPNPHPPLWGLLRPHWYSLIFRKNQRHYRVGDWDRQRTSRRIGHWVHFQHWWSTRLLPAQLYILTRVRSGCCEAQVLRKKYTLQRLTFVFKNTGVAPEGSPQSREVVSSNWFALALLRLLPANK